MDEKSDLTLDVCDELISRNSGRQNCTSLLNQIALDLWALMPLCVFLFIVAWRQTLLSIYLFDHRPIFVYFYINSAQKPDTPPFCPCSWWWDVSTAGVEEQTHSSRESGEVHLEHLFHGLQFTRTVSNSWWNTLISKYTLYASFQLTFLLKVGIIQKDSVNHFFYISYSFIQHFTPN